MTPETEKGHIIKREGEQERARGGQENEQNSNIFTQANDASIVGIFTVVSDRLF